MLIRSPEVEVPVEEPFSGDALGRADLEPTLTAFVELASGPLVLAIDGRFGTGKTTFLRMWQQHLTNRKHACLYMNAWATDFADDPLVAIVGELSSAIASLPISGKPKARVQKAFMSVKDAASAITKRSIPGLLRVASAGILDGNELADGLAAVVEDVAEDRIKAYEEGKSEIEKFRTSLVDLAAEVARLDEQASGKVIILVDELDRCRPIYAIELLERIKHLFSTEGIVFVLGVDRSQLSHSVRALYGTGFDASGYLRRFIDIDYRLPPPNAGDFCQHLLRVYGISELVLSRQSRERQSELKFIEQILTDLFAAARFSLREQEQTVARLRVVLQTVPLNHYLFELSLSVLLFLREWDSDAYQSFVDQTIQVDHLLERIEGLPGMSKVFGEHRGHLIEAALIAGASELELPTSRLAQYNSVLNQDQASEDRRRRADRVLAITNSISGGFEGGAGFKETFRRVELAKPFVEPEPSDEAG